MGLGEAPMYESGTRVRTRGDRGVNPARPVTDISDIQARPRRKFYFRKELALHRLTNAIRNYAWGSRTHIPRLLGAEPSAEPAAELWIGAHEGDPSYLPDGRSLTDAIAADPLGTLGPRVAARFDGRLPYLVKLLAAAEPLSLQVHPTSERARLGFAEEEARGVPLAASYRSYRDRSHKPELVFALTRFEGMAGFRDVAKSAQILRLLGLDWADSLADRLEAATTPFQTVRQIVTELLRGGPDLEKRITDLRMAAEVAEQRNHREDPRMRPPTQDRSAVQREATRVFAQTVALADRYPEDPGVLVTLLLNHVVLAAGDAMFLDAGVVHAYTSGFGVEVMAASDNVLRAGLTPKHIDVDELLEITNFTPMPPPLWAPTSPAGMKTTLLEPPVSEFALRVGPAAETAVPEQGPRVVLGLEGSCEVVLTATGAVETVTPGVAVFVPHSDGSVTLSGDGRVAVVSVP